MQLPVGATSDNDGDGNPDVVWEELPRRVQRGGRPRVWESRLTQFTGNPGEWGVVENYEGDLYRAQTTASNLRHHAVLPPGRWEFKARLGVVYGRYLGEQSQDD